MVLLCYFTQPFDPSYFEAFITFNFQAKSVWNSGGKKGHVMLCVTSSEMVCPSPSEQIYNAAYYLKELDIDLEWLTRPFKKTPKHDFVKRSWALVNYAYSTRVPHKLLHIPSLFHFPHYPTPSATFQIMSYKRQTELELEEAAFWLDAL